MDVCASVLVGAGISFILPTPSDFVEKGTSKVLSPYFDETASTHSVISRLSEGSRFIYPLIAQKEFGVML